MADNVQIKSGGVSILGLLGVAFIVLKLAGLGVVANWPWLWVLAPFWVPIAIGLAVIVGGFLIGMTGYALYFLIKAWGERKK